MTDKQTEFRSVALTAKHTALLVETLGAGQAVPGVICQKQAPKSGDKQEPPANTHMVCVCARAPGLWEVD